MSQRPVAVCQLGSGMLLLGIRTLEVGPVFLILFAGIRHDLRVLTLDGQSNGPGLGIKLRIFEGDCPLDVVFINPLEALGQMQLIAVLMAGRIDPGAVIQPDRIDHQGAAFPVSDGVAKPRRVEIFWMASAVGVNDAEGALVLKQDSGYSGRLNNLERHETSLDASGRADGQTLRQRVVNLVFFFEEVRSIGRKWRLVTEGFRNIRREGRRPDAV